MLSELAITFSKEDIDTITWVGDSYSWASIMSKYVFEDGEEVVFSDSDVQVIAEEFDSDTEGGHNYFPLLNPASELAEKLTRIYRRHQENTT